MGVHWESGEPRIKGRGGAGLIESGAPCLVCAFADRVCDCVSTSV